MDLFKDAYKTAALRMRRLGRDESGQSALFAVVTLMLLIIVIAFTFNVGMTVNQRVRLQHAADSAAFSGAVVEANAMSSIAWLNNCQTYMHSKLQQHMLDVVMYSTASAIAEWGHYTYDKYNSKSDRKAYETQIIPHFLPVPFIADNDQLEVFGAMKNLSGASNGYPPTGSTNSSDPSEPATEFTGVFDHCTFKNEKDTDLQDIFDQLKSNLNSLPSTISGMDNPLEGVMDILAGALDPAQIVSDIGTSIVEGIGEAMVKAAKGALTTGSFNFNFQKVLVNAIKDALSETFSDLVEGLVGDLTDFAGETIQNAISDILSALLEMEAKQFKTFEEVFDQDIFERINSKYGISAASPQDIIAATKNNILPDAKAWIADSANRKRLGETWIRQMSLAASAIAQALPELVRNEILYSVSINAYPETRVAIFPAPPTADGKAYTGDVKFIGSPALITDDSEDTTAFFRYDSYFSDPLKNRYLSESRRQAYAQGFKYVREEDDKSIALKPEIEYWWDEFKGQVKMESGKSVFVGMEKCWNKKDRLVTSGCPDDDICPIGYAPGRTPGSPMAKPIDRDNAADGHWHLEHGHSHGPDCKRTYGGFCIGYMPPGVFRCLLMSLSQEIAGQNHHLKYLNHETNFHWDPIADELKHVYCEVAWSNASKGMDLFGSKKQADQGEDEEKSRYPDIIPGIRFMKICWCLLKTRFQFMMIGPFPILLIYCTCGQHGTPPSNPPQDVKWSGKTNNTQKHGLPVGCFPGFIYDYIPLPWGWPVSNWPSGQNFPGHFYTKADWEGRFSGDKYYYDRNHYMSFDGECTESVTGQGIPDALLGELPESLQNALYVTAEVYGRISNWTSRKGHHGFMTCPLCMKPCPACGAVHMGMDRDGDEQSDVGMLYSEALNKHDYTSGSYSDYDLDLNIDEGADGIWSDNFACDRFNRQWTSPERGIAGDPRVDLAPTVVATENFFRYGITVGLYAPHKTYFFKKFFGKRSGYTAVATARAGFVEQGGILGSPQIITGAGEAQTSSTDWTLDDVRNNFLTFSSNKSPRSNLYYPAWGAKLVSSRDGILPGGMNGTLYDKPTGTVADTGTSKDAEAALWRHLGNTQCYMPDGSLTTEKFKDVVMTGLTDSWDEFVKDYINTKRSLNTSVSPQ